MGLWRRRPPDEVTRANRRSANICALFMACYIGAGFLPWAESLFALLFTAIGLWILGMLGASAYQGWLEHWEAIRPLTPHEQELAEYYRTHPEEVLTAERFLAQYRVPVIDMNSPTATIPIEPKDDDE